MIVIKRDGREEDFNIDKIQKAVFNAFKSNNKEVPIVLVRHIDYFFSCIQNKKISVEEIQDNVEDILMTNKFFGVAKSYILYREKHKQARFIKERLDYMNNYSKSTNNASTASETDANANVTVKNVANLEGEVYKTTNRIIQRNRMKDKLQELFPEVADKYKKDLEHHIIYQHDEASTPVLKNYCGAVSLYPLLTEGTKSMDGLNTTTPKNLNSFCGQLVNLTFLLASQCKGAVAYGEFFNFFNYFCVKDFGEDYINHIDDIASLKPYRTIKDSIHQAYQQIVYGWNQPAGNRGYQSPFVNISYYDSNYWKALFSDFYFPDGTQPKWENINWLQKDFMQWFNKERTKTLLTFPVETMALLSDNKDIIDKEYKNFTAKMWAEGHSFFVYINDSPTSLASCCFTKDTKVLWKDSINGVHNTTLEYLYNLKWEDTRNLRIYHNGTWIKGKSVKTNNRPVYKVTTQNNKEFYMTDNHINITYNGEVNTENLTTEDYLMFNTKSLESIKENDEKLTYAQGLLVGLFIGDGTFGNYVCLDNSVHSFHLSLNKEKWEKVSDILRTLGNFKLGTIYNNLYPIYCNNKDLTTFISKWTTNEPNNTTALNKNLNINCILQSKEFRQGILDGWYITDGGNSNRCYTISKNLVESMEILCTSLGKQCVINISNRTDEDVIIRGEYFNRNYPLYCLRWYDDTNSRCRPESGFKWKNNSIYWKVKSIEKIDYTDNAYCIKCNNIDEPYFTLPNGLITHNCRLANEIQENTFSFTNGLSGVMTGSCNVITLNLNRIIQDWSKSIDESLAKEVPICTTYLFKSLPNNKGIFFKDYFIKILDRVYKYHITYKTMLYELEDSGMLTSSNAGYIKMNKLYSTIGINGMNEAAKFLGINVSYNKDYEKFCNLITSTIKEQNKLHNIKDSKKPFLFNTEFVPAESLGTKNYNWDKKDGYIVPLDENLYNSYFYDAHDNTSVLDKLKLHGKEFTGTLDGGVGCHINLENHLSKEQYLKLIELAVKYKTTYFTFNIPNCQCDDCGHIEKKHFNECPVCNSKNVTDWTRIIGYLRPIKLFDESRKKEATKRVYTSINSSTDISK